MRYAVIGAAGQLGRDLCRLAPEAVALTRAEIDLSRPETIAGGLDAVHPDVVFNCAAFNFVDRAEAEPDAAFAVNALGVHHLARACRERDVVLVHVSTDYVFGRGAERQTPYRETDPPAPTCVYAVSKLAGEHLASLWDRSFVVRTCGVYGHAGLTSQKGNFVEMILRQIAQDRPLRVVDDQRCTPTSSADLAAGLLALVGTNAYGLYHLTNLGDCRWLDFAQAICDLKGDRRPIQPVRTADFGSPARRPSYSVLDCSKYRSLGLVPLRPWREALADYLANRPTS